MLSLAQPCEAGLGFFYEAPPGRAKPNPKGSLRTPSPPPPKPKVSCGGLGEKVKSQAI